MQSHLAQVRLRAQSNHFQSLTASNFEALWPIDLKFSAFKDLFPFSIVSKVQEAGSILKVVFALSKWPHSHRAYLVTVCNQNFIAVYLTLYTRRGCDYNILWKMFSSADFLDFLRMTFKKISSAISHQHQLCIDKQITFFGPFWLI